MIVDKRISNLLKSPEILELSDLDLLKRTISKFPYAQAFRALYLFGLYKFSRKQYEENLSLTAGYTTDKKRLHKLINDLENIRVQQENLKSETSGSSLSKTFKAEDRKSFKSESISEETPAFTIPEDTTLLPDEKRIVEIEEESLSFNDTDSFFPSVKFVIPEKREQKINTREKEEKDESCKKEFLISDTKFLKGESSRSIPQDHSWSQMREEIPSYDSLVENEEKLKIDHSFFEENSIAENQEKSREKVASELELGSEATEQEEVCIKQSNVESFLNTWEKWFKKEKPAALSFKESEKIIDSFIEKNPKISPVKKDSPCLVRERGDDISHLMTETLAKMYLEQRLYTKAISAYEILQKKNPRKASEFKENILQIEEMKNQCKLSQKSKPL